MSFHSKFLFILFAINLCLFSCNSGNSENKSLSNEANNTAQITQTQNPEAKNSTPSKSQEAYYDAMVEYVKLNPRKTKLLKNIDKKYKFKIRKLKLDDKWIGKANMSTRKTVQNEKNEEILELIGKSNYRRYTEFTKNWGK